MINPRRANRISTLVFGILIVAMANCSNEECRLCAPKDTTAPAAVGDLTAGDSTSTSVILLWLSPGDDGDVGTAFRYDIRYDTDTITEAGWGSADQVNNEPAPKPANSSEALHVEGLVENTRYFFALKTEDENGNWSDLSNVPSDTTLAATGLLEIVTARCMVFSLLIFLDNNYVGSFGNELPIAIEVPLGSHILYAHANIVVADTSYCWTKGFTITEGQRSAVLVLDCLGAACTSLVR